MKFQDAVERLGEPAVQIGECAIFNLDCVKGMQALPPGFVNLTVTSPPYNIGKEYEEPLPLGEYLDWCQLWIAEVSRLTTEDGAFWLNLGYLSIPGRAKAIPIPYLLWDRVPLYLVQEVVWNYGAGVAGRLFFSPRNEKFLWYVKDENSYYFDLDSVRDPNVKYPNQKKNGKIKVNALGKNPSDVWYFPKVTSGANRASKERTSHPAQFPVAVIERIIKATSRPGDIVLDPFMGSGTTAEVALRLGRRVLGFEIQSAYIDVIARRLEATQAELEASRAQLTLF